MLVFTSRRGVEGIAGGKLTLGVGASAAAGPVGRQAEAAAGVAAEVYAYSRSRGLFAGIALDGTSITIGDKSNDAWYGRRDVLASEIMSGATTAPDSENARAFPVPRWRPALVKPRTPPAPSPAPAAPSTADHAGRTPAAAAAPASGTVQTFPMEDPSPGTEPPR